MADASKGGWVRSRGNVLGEHAAARLLKRHALGGERFQPLRYAGKRFSNG